MSDTEFPEGLLPEIADRHLDPGDTRVGPLKPRQEKKRRPGLKIVRKPEVRVIRRVEPEPDNQTTQPGEVKVIRRVS